MPIDPEQRDHVLSEKSPSTHADEHGLAKPQPHPSPKLDAEHPGYEVTDVNTKGVVTCRKRLQLKVRKVHPQLNSCKTQLVLPAVLGLPPT